MSYSSSIKPGGSRHQVQVQRQEEGEASAPQTDEEARAAFDQGRAAYEAGDYQEALRHFEAATQASGLDPSRMPDLIWNMALARAHLGDIDGAMTEAMTYGQYHAARPASELIEQIENMAAQQSGEQEQAPAASAQTDEAARAEFEQGRAAYEAGNYQEALRHFEAASQAPGLDPSRMPDLIWNLAQARAHLGDIDGAMTEAMTYGQYNPAQASQLIEQIERIGAQQSGEQEQAPAAAPQTDEEARAEFEQGRGAYEAGRYEEALRHFEAATQAPGLDPSRMPDLIWNLALTKARLGDRENALTEAMTYGQYRPNEALIESIQMIFNASESEAPASAD
jgi:tetratricopeptide (TPR) repeat protein